MVMKKEGFGEPAKVSPNCADAQAACQLLSCLLGAGPASVPLTLQSAKLLFGVRPFPFPILRLRGGKSMEANGQTEVGTPTNLLPEALLQLASWMCQPWALLGK